MMRTYQLAAAHLLEQTQLITHWEARLSMCLHYVLRQHDEAIGRATHIYVAAARASYTGLQLRQAHTTFTIKEQIFMGNAIAPHHHTTHALHTACHACVWRAYRHACMIAISSYATFLLGRRRQQIFNDYQRKSAGFNVSEIFCATLRLRVRLPHTPHHTARAGLPL